MDDDALELLEDGSRRTNSSPWSVTVSGCSSKLTSSTEYVDALP
ncbi:hypothetical protein [Natronococcus sp. A-GB7]|nr:hypothetical protein [Natronococcus sp. A-GB7]MDG5819546.1 hypothetical protein [Natronococcus sp. A-GB7]